MLAVIDYGGGNLGSLVAALRRRGADFTVSSDPKVVANAAGAIFPGDGAFAATMHALVVQELDDAIRALVVRGRPFLGICVGMQVLYERSAEFGDAPGLGIFPGTIERFSDTAPRVPHMGWNALEVRRAHPLLAGLPSQPYAYFLHSYRAAEGEETIAAATHGERFSAVVARDNVMGTQFHPEKSQHTGAKILDNFLRQIEE